MRIPPHSSPLRGEGVVQRIELKRVRVIVLPTLRNCEQQLSNNLDLTAERAPAARAEDCFLFPLAAAADDTIPLVLLPT